MRGRRCLRLSAFYLPDVFLYWIFLASVYGLSHSPFAWGKAVHLSGDLTIFHAGSLAVPFQEIAQAFSQHHPRVRIHLEASGSRTAARKIADLQRTCDVIAVSDYKVIESLLIPDYAEWYILFATNELVIAYTEASRYSHEISGQNWHQLILDPEVRFGRSEPTTDPCGYRTLFLAALAEKFYTIPHFSKLFLKKDIRFIRPKETDLLALLETAAVDYIFIYRSVALQHQLHWISLPDEINLSNPKMEHWYETVSVEVSGKTPDSRIMLKGETILYAVSIPKSTINPEAALAFVHFLLDKDQGLPIMKKHGQCSVVPMKSSTFHLIPEPLRKFALHP